MSRQACCARILTAHSIATVCTRSNVSILWLVFPEQNFLFLDCELLILKVCTPTFRSLCSLLFGPVLTMTTVGFPETGVPSAVFQ